MSRKVSVDVPLYIKAGYELWGASIEGISVVFASIKDESVDIRVHQNAYKRLSEITSCEIVLVFEKLDSRSANSLIKKQVAFVLKDKQIYMPFALMQIQTQNSQNIPIKPAFLSSDADMILIGYLDDKISDGMIIKGIAQIINRELRATSQALKLLESLGYVHIDVQGRCKYMYFISKKEIYDRLKMESKSPIKYTFFTKNFPTKTVYSGYTALSNYSTLIDSQTQTLAISHKMITAKELESLQCDEDEALQIVEVWDRDPSIFSHDETINPMYVVRFFYKDDDERVQEAIENIEIKIIKKLEDKDERD